MAAMTRSTIQAIKGIASIKINMYKKYTKIGVDSNTFLSKK